MFDDFCIAGCWNWVRDWRECEYFSEIFQRYEAAKLGIAPAANFDDCEARLLEGILTVNREIELAQAEKAKRKAKK